MQTRKQIKFGYDLNHHKALSEILNTFSDYCYTPGLASPQLCVIN